MQKIGIFALQGDFEKHKIAVQKLGYQALEIRSAAQLRAAKALIIPGGESTTLLKLIHHSHLDKELHEFAQDFPIMGTCAGLILLAREANDLPYPTLNLIDIKVQRNAYGRQRESFVDNITLNLNGVTHSFMGVFIRAPKIIEHGSNIKILATHGKDAVMVANDRILTSTFHPELSDNLHIHEYFLDNYLR